MIKDYIIDGDSGEVKRELNGDYRIISIKQDEFLKETMEFNKDEKFIKKFSRTSLKLYKSLNNAELLILEIMLQYLRYTSGVVAFENGIHITKHHLSEMSEYSVRNVERLIKGLIDKQVIARCRTGNDIMYYINPFLYVKGERINKTLFEIFKNTKWAKL